MPAIHRLVCTVMFSDSSLPNLIPKHFDLFPIKKINMNLRGKIHANLDTAKAVGRRHQIYWKESAIQLYFVFWMEHWVDILSYECIKSGRHVFINSYFCWLLVIHLVRLVCACFQHHDQWKLPLQCKWFSSFVTRLPYQCFSGVLIKSNMNHTA